MSKVKRFMRGVKFGFVGLAALCVILGIVYNLPSWGGQGIFTMGLLVVPLLLGILSIKPWNGIPRWAAIVSFLSLFLAAMKTSEGFENIMVAAFVGSLLALGLAIIPDQPSEGSSNPAATQT